MNCQGLARRAEDFARQSFPRAQPGARWRKDRASREEVCRAPGLSSRAAVPGRRCPAAADLPVEGRRQVPEPGRPPAEVTTNEEQGRPGWAETPRGAPPPPGWLRIGSGQPELGAGRWTACLIPAPVVRECEGCPSVLRWRGGLRNLRTRGYEEGEGRGGKSRVGIVGFGGARGQAQTAEPASSETSICMRRAGH